MSGIFGLNYVYNQKLNNSSNDYSKPGWHENSTYGYSEMEAPDSPPAASYQRRRYLRQDLSTGVLSLTNTLFPDVNYENGEHSVLESKHHGYSIGGSRSAGYTSSIRKFEFSTETGFDLTAYLNGNVGRAFDVQSDENGYILGGTINNNNYTVNHLTYITRLDFSTDQYTNFTSTNLSRKQGGDVESQKYGYLLGGFDGFPPTSNNDFYKNTISRLDFSTENLDTLNNYMPEKIEGVSGLDSNSYGYYAGGLYYDPSANQLVVTSSIGRIDFDTDTTSTTSAKIVQAVTGLTNMNGYTHGYYLGGDAGGVTYSQIVKLDFSTETTTVESGDRYTGDTFANPNSNVTNPARYDRLITRTNRKGVSNRGRLFRPNGYSTTGYICGGTSAISSPISYYSHIQRINFSTETGSLVGNKLPFNVNQTQVASSNNHGYLITGRASPYAAQASETGIKRVDFVTEVPIEISNKAPFGRKGGGCISDSENAYLSGGGFDTPFTRSAISKLNFTTDTSSDTSMAIRNTNYWGSSGVSDGIYGYFVGGVFDPTGGTPNLEADHSSVSKLDFSSETLSNLSNLTENIGSSIVVQNKSYGFFMANLGPLSTSNPNTYKLDFTTGSMSDTGVVAFGPPGVPQTYSGGGAVSGDYYGYIGGNHYGGRTGYRFDYTTSTQNELPNLLPVGCTYSGGLKNSEISTQ